MRTVGLSEAKQKLSELVERAGQGEKIAITRHRKVMAVLVPAVSEVSLRGIFEDIERIRKRAKVGRPVSMKELIEEGRS